MTSSRYQATVTLFTKKIPKGTLHEVKVLAIKG